MFSKFDEAMMRAALEEARWALEEGEVPVGAVIVKAGAVIARGRNRRERTNDPTAHAEIVALREAARATGNWRLTGCTMYVTLEPCPMCAGALLNARMDRVVFGAFDTEAGCAGSVYRMTEDPAFVHFCPADGGLLKDMCAHMMRRFTERCAPLNRADGEA